MGRWTIVDPGTPGTVAQSQAGSVFTRVDDFPPRVWAMCATSGTYLVTWAEMTASGPVHILHAPDRTH
jgi:hypothetical protein